MPHVSRLVTGRRIQNGKLHHREIVPPGLPISLPEPPTIVLKSFAPVKLFHNLTDSVGVFGVTAAA